MNGLKEDLYQGCRALAKNRGFAAAAILSLALGIGANTTIFTFINAIFLQPLPVEDPSTLAGVVTLDSRIPGYLGTSYPNYQDYRDHIRSFSSLLLYSTIRGTLTGQGSPQSLVFQMVTGNYFQCLGVKPVVGRAFLEEEDRVPGANPVAVISHALWMRRYGGDPQVPGQTISVNGHSLQIIGVAPPAFQGLNLLVPTEVWVPIMMYRELYPRPAWITLRRALPFTVAGRLKPGVTRAQAEAEMQTLAEQLDREYRSDNQGRKPKLIPLAEGGISRGTRDSMTNSGAVLMVVAGLILLIACANVANLLLARAAGRNKEIAVRLALGASRWRLIRQLLTESTVLALAGGGLGLLIARWGSSILWALRPPWLRTAVFNVTLDERVLSFTLFLSVVTGILFGLVPALRATKSDLATDLKERASKPASGFRHPRSMLVALEVSFCVVALIGAGLFIRSLANAEHVDPGFDADHLGMVSFNVSDQNYSQERGHQFQRQLLERAAALPGVVSVALSRDSLLRVSFSRTIVIDGETQAPEGHPILTTPVSPNYFHTTGIALMRGRDFSPQDSQNTPRVVIVNETAAANYWPSQNPIGKLLRIVGDGAPLEVIGVARNANYRVLGEAPQPLIYTSIQQEYESASTLIYRTNGNPEAVEASVRREMQALDPNLLLEPEIVRAVIRNSLWAPRLSAGLLGVFGILGLVLATLGVYGVVSYSVNQRVREIGVRMALGATAADVQVLILRQAMGLVTVGVVAGLLIALGASSAVQRLLFVTSARDGLTFVLVPSILVLAAIAACWGPAHRATRIDPAIALRDE